MMQPLERGKYTIGVFLIKTHAVVLDLETTDVAVPCARGKARRCHVPADSDRRRAFRLPKFDRVSDQVLKKLPHLQRICFKLGKLLNDHFRINLFDRDFKIGEHADDDFVEVNHDK